MASLVLAGDTSGSITVSAPAVAGSSTQTLVAVTDTLAPVVRGTAVTASGTSVDFTSIPSWVKRITVMFNGVSTNGTSVVRIQLGTSSGVTTSGYLGSASTIATGVATSNFTAGFDENSAGGSTAASVRQGSYTIQNLTSNTWTCNGLIGFSNEARSSTVAGVVPLAATLDRVRITTANGTDTFDAGTINILYE